MDLLTPEEKEAFYEAQKHGPPLYYDKSKDLYFFLNEDIVPKLDTIDSEISLELTPLELELIDACQKSDGSPIPYDKKRDLYYVVDSNSPEDVVKSEKSPELISTDSLKLTPLEIETCQKSHVPPVYYDEERDLYSFKNLEISPKPDSSTDLENKSPYYPPEFAPSKELIAASEALKGAPIKYDKGRGLYYVDDNQHKIVRPESTPSKELIEKAQTSEETPLQYDEDILS